VNRPFRFQKCCQDFIVRADEKLTAFVELERAIHEFAVDLISNGCSGSAQDHEGRTIWIADAQRDDRNLSFSTAKSDRHLANYDEQS
jgi:hypothetical protein